MLNFVTTFVHFLSKDLFISARSTALAWLPRIRLAALFFGLNFDVFIWNTSPPSHQLDWPGICDRDLGDRTEHF